MGLYSGFDAARASWEFPEGTCAGFLGYPSDPVSDGLESTTGDGDQDTLDNDQDTAVKICFSAAGLGGVRTSWEAVASVPLSRYSSTRRRSLVSLMLWPV